MCCSTACCSDQTHELCTHTVIVAHSQGAAATLDALGGFRELAGWWRYPEPDSHDEAEILGLPGGHCLPEWSFAATRVSNEPLENSITSAGDNTLIRKLQSQKRGRLCRLNLARPINPHKGKGQLCACRLRPLSTPCGRSLRRSPTSGLAEIPVARPATRRGPDSTHCGPSAATAAMLAYAPKRSPNRSHRP